MLVSTSIGEEGLDIGEIDMIVCYDAQKTPIRMVSAVFSFSLSLGRLTFCFLFVVQLQRIGRTGRKRDGHVHVLLSEDREEHNWDKADDNYKEVQRFIIKAEHLELYGDVERLVPAQFKPECVEMVMDIEEYKREEPARRKGPSTPKKPKRVRNDDAMRNIPLGASTTFVSVKDLLRKPKKRKKGEKEKTLEELGMSDEDDRAIAAGLSYRTVSMPNAGDKARKELRTAATMPVGAPPRRKKAKKAPPLETLAEDDSDDDAIANGISGATSKPSSKPKPKPKPRPPKKVVSVSGSHKPPPPVSIPSSSPSDTDDRGLSETAKTPAVPSATWVSTQPAVQNNIFDLTTPVQRDLPPRWPSPDIPVAATSKRLPTPASSPVSSAGEVVDAPNPSMAWLLDDDDDLDIPLVGSSPFTRRTREQNSSSADSDVELLGKARLVPRTAGRAPADSQLAMPPPTLPAISRAPMHSAVVQEHNGASSSPAMTFAVRGPAKAARKRVYADSSSPLVVASTPQRRIRRRSSCEPDDDSERVASPGPRPKKRKKQRFADIVEAKRHNPWIDVEASQSGEEGSADEDEDSMMTEADRGFIAADATQVSPSYDQAAVYRRSLMTQAPGGTVPKFARAPLRRGVGAFVGPSRGRAQVSSSPPRDSEPDEYVFGSFVVADDTEDSYLNDNQPSSES